MMFPNEDPIASLKRWLRTVGMMFVVLLAVGIVAFVVEVAVERGGDGSASALFFVALSIGWIVRGLQDE